MAKKQERAQAEMKSIIEAHDALKKEQDKPAKKTKRN